MDSGECSAQALENTNPRHTLLIYNGSGKVEDPPLEE